MNRRSVLPKYYQLELSLRRRIAELPIGTALPSEPELSREYGISRTTLRQAIDALIADSLVERIQGKGTFVTGRKVDFPLDYEKRSKSVEASTEHQLLRFERLAAGPELSTLFAIAPDDEILRVERMSKFGGVRMGVGTLVVPATVAKDLQRDDFEHGRFFYTLLDHGVSLQRYRLMIESVVIDPSMARLLDVRPGLPSIGLIRHAFDEAGQLVARVSIVTRGDVGRYILELPIAGDAVDGASPLTFEMI